MKKEMDTQSKSKFSMSFSKTSVALAAATFLLAACGVDNQPVAEDPTTTTTPQTTEEPVELAEETNVQLGDLTGNVEDYIGQTVSVRGEAETAVGEESFVLQDDQLFGGEEVIVLNATGEPFLLPTNDEPTDEVQVTGEVQQLVLAEFEREYGLALDPELYAEYENRPAIVAESIAFSPDPEELSENPEAYYGQVIAVAGAVGEQVSANTFTLQEEQLFGGEEVLVVGTIAQLPVDPNEEIVVTGTLRPYVAAEFERDYDLTWDLDLQEQIEAEYSNEPVLVADEVYPSAE